MKIAELSDYGFRWEWVDGDDIEKSIGVLIHARYWVHDADNCGDRRFILVFGKNGYFRYFKVYHRWEWDNYGEEDANLENTFDWEEITEAEARQSVKKWLVV